ncbi:MAG: dihydroneopterin aldolase [Rhodospirillales bacterium]
MPQPRLQTGPLGSADIDPAGQGLTRVFIRDLVLPASIGIYDHEKARRQRVRFNIELLARLPEGGPDDAVPRDVVSYELVVKRIRKLLAAGHVNLVETLAERVAELALKDRRVAAARVRVEKLDVYKGAAVGVEIERRAPARAARLRAVR